MLEILLLLFVIIAIFVFENLMFTVFALSLVVFLVAPGVYAMLSGAPFLPTTRKTMKQIIDFAQLQPDTRVVDLGCGDGRMIRKIAEKGVKRAVGYEFSVPTFLAAKVWGLFSGKGEEIYYRNFWTQSYRHFDVVVCFLMKGSMRRFEKEVWPKLSKGTRVISNAFRMPNVKPLKKSEGVYLYVKK